MKPRHKPYEDASLEHFRAFAIIVEDVDVFTLT